MGCADPATTGAAAPPAGSPEARYLEALDDLIDGSYTEAATVFEQISASTLNPVLAQAATLRLGDALFLQSRHAEAAEVYRQYLEQYPNSPDAPHAGYMRGLSFLRRMPEDVWIVPPPESREMSDVESAYQAFVAVIQRSPEAFHAMKARVLLAQTIERKCRHDLYVARYYQKNDMPLAVAQRLEKAIAAEEAEKQSGWLPESFLCAASKDNVLDLARAYSVMGKADGVRRAASLYEKYSKYFRDADKGAAEIRAILEKHDLRPSDRL